MSQRIQVLSGPVADQIAAGEVVERPASVVKELVENALDAGATTVDIAVQEGGRTLIRVSDNGSGMLADDALLALERHATSKIRSAEDLVGVASFGFRGEALPAIASVADIVLESAAKDGDGTLVRGTGGVVSAVESVARRQGTTVQVQRLFHNTPARQKFLKGVRSEWRAISETVASIALLRRDVHFTLSHNGKSSLDLPVAPSLRARVGALWGTDSVARFVDLDDVYGVVHVRGMVERPADVGTRTRRVLLMVNGRIVRDIGITRAVEAAYRSTIPAGVRPSMVLDITLPATGVDVNVHPAKAEIRIHDRWPAERAIEQIIRRALGEFDAAAGMGWRVWTPGVASSGTTGTPSAERGGHSGEVQPWMLRMAPSVGGPLQAAALEDAASAVAAGDARESGTPAGDAAAGDGAAAAAAGGAVGAAADDAAAGDTERVAVAAASPPPTAIDVPPLLQLRRMYLMFEHEEGVVLIDQHAAHERVLYERFLQ
jgi:DNA mismatch repair protein MutL